MSPWLVATWALAGLLALAGVGCLRGDAMARLAALQLAATLAALLLAVLAVVLAGDYYLDVALTLALIATIGSLGFIRFTERWL